jgi:ubiquinone/menaquinone biosynthesis C-methylase UbiE
MKQATAYDALNHAIFWPWGGSRHLRQRLVDTLQVRRGHRVLELGCGTGQVTARLLAAGATVVAVDALPPMLARAASRASQATFIQGDALTTDVGTDFDCVALSFVLHNFDGDGRIQLLRRSEAALAPGGRIGVLERSLPPGRRRAALWRRFLSALEPSPAAAEVLTNALEQDIAAAGLQIASQHSAAGGRARILVLRRSTASAHVPAGGHDG